MADRQTASPDRAADQREERRKGGLHRKRTILPRAGGAVLGLLLIFAALTACASKGVSDAGGSGAPDASAQELNPGENP